MGISLKEVSYSYNYKKKKPNFILKDISLEIADKDEFITIVGETGSGKSTLSLIMNGIRIPNFGDAFINGVKIKKNHSKKDKYNNLRKHVGVVFQFPDYQLFEETVLKDVAFAPRNFGKKKEEAIEIAKKSLAMVHLNESFYDRSPFMLSGGEKKMVSIAGILAMEPDILIFDEPTAGLDPESRKRVVNLFKELNEGYHKTIIIITHDMNIVNEYSKRVIVMNKGNLMYDGTPLNLFENNMNIVKESNLDFPETYKLARYLNEKNNLNLYLYHKNKNDLVDEIMNIKEKL